MPWRPAVAGRPGYQNGTGSCTGRIGSGIVGKSKWRLRSLETSPVRRASQMMPRMSAKCSPELVQSLLNQ